MVRQLSEGWCKCRGDKNAKTKPQTPSKGCRKPRILEDLDSTARAEQSMPAAVSRDGQALVMGSSGRSTSSCLARRQDAVLLSVQCR